MSQSHLKNARDVTRRMLCVAALVYRREIEGLYSGEPIQLLDDLDPYVEHVRLLNWLVAENLLPCLTETETLLISRPLGEWSSRALTMTHCRLETLGMLLWALRLLDTVPDADTPFLFNQFAASLDILTPTIDLLWCAELRPVEQLYRMRDSLELWDWRCHAAELITMGVRPPHGVSYQDIIRVTAEQAHADGTLPALIDGDFPAFGRSFAALSRPQFRLVKHIAAERYHTISWVTEHSAEWEGLPADL